MAVKLPRSDTPYTHEMYRVVPATRPFLLLTRAGIALVASISLKNHSCAILLPLWRLCAVVPAAVCRSLCEAIKIK